MLRECDYRFCTKISLQILKEQRKKLYNDSIGNMNSSIRTALHKTDEFEHEIRTLYFEQYCVQWLDEHWNMLNSLLEDQRKNNKKFTNKDKKDTVQFFAKYFCELLSICFESTPVLLTSAIPELLHTKRIILQTLIKNDEKWHENYDSLYADKTKHQEQYRKLIEEALVRSESKNK